MSASLVGSEMCIRDSMLVGPVAPGRLPESTGRQAGTPVVLGAAPLHPVSYTHLTLPTICSV
eukprot:932340-Alexandrium_andersonii.AAC.1